MGGGGLKEYGCCFSHCCCRCTLPVIGWCAHIVVWWWSQCRWWPSTIRRLMMVMVMVMVCCAVHRRHIVIVEVFVSTNSLVLHHHDGVLGGVFSFHVFHRSIHVIHHGGHQCEHMRPFEYYELKERLEMTGIEVWRKHRAQIRRHDWLTHVSDAIHEIHTECESGDVCDDMMRLCSLECVPMPFFSRRWWAIRNNDKQWMYRRWWCIFKGCQWTHWQSYDCTNTTKKPTKAMTPRKTRTMFRWFLAKFSAYRCLYCLWLFMAFIYCRNGVITSIVKKEGIQRETQRNENGGNIEPQYIDVWPMMTKNEEKRHYYCHRWYFGWK